ncbi:MAG: hypothetical protein JNM11_03485 [Chitinimonas sp.]|nr:hypothetical protein [Chitinimonas sp.]
MVEALLGGLEGGAAFMAKDSDRRIQEQQKVMDREALFSDWQRRYNIEMSTNAAEDDRRSARNAKQQLESHKAKEAFNLSLANDPRALEAERRAGAQREREISLSQGPQYARIKYEKERDAKRDLNMVKAVPLIARLKMLRSAQPNAAQTEQDIQQEVANVCAGLWQLGVDPSTVWGQDNARANRPIDMEGMANKARAEYLELKRNGKKESEAEDHIRRTYPELDKYPALW